MVRTLLFGAILVMPLCVFAYTSVITKPKDQRTIVTIQDSALAQEFFGRLDGFPHTFEFEVSTAHPFKVLLSVPDIAVQKNDLSVIVVKQERRGVTEVKRTVIKEQLWEATRDRMLVESFRNGGTLEAHLEPGVYTLEVSSPNNEGKYRLVLGTEKINRGYFANLRTLFEVKAFLDNSKFGALFSPLLYVPILLLLCISVIFIYRRKKNQTA
jgi:hypothetical protein